MWTQSTMSIPESLMISLIGIVVVFLALVVLAIAILVISAVVRGLVGGEKKAPAKAPAAAAVNDEKDKELMAVLTSVIAEDTGLPTNQLKITAVKEI